MSERTPYQLTEPRELVLRAIATAADIPGIERPVLRPLPLSAPDIGHGVAWLHTHGYLTDQVTPSAKGVQVAVWLSRADRHDAIVEDWPRRGRPGRHRGTRVRCSCGWGGSRIGDDLIHATTVGLHHGGRSWAAVEHQGHLDELAGRGLAWRDRRDQVAQVALARLAALHGDEDPL